MGLTQIVEIMKTFEIELQAENGVIKLPANLENHYNAKVRVTIFLEEKEQVNFGSATQKTQNAVPQTNAEKYAKYIDTNNLDIALEGLLVVAKAISNLNKEQETLHNNLLQYEKHSLELMRQAKNGEKTVEESNALVMENLQKEEQAKAQVDAKIKELSELEYIKTQIQEVVSRLKMQQEVQKTVNKKMPDSSETIDAIERMKSKISENEALGSIYEKFKNAKEIDPETEKRINEILDMEAQKRQEAVEELKKKMGIV